MLPPTSTQLQRVNEFRGTFHELFPALAAAKDGMRKVIAEADKSPDGSIDELHRSRLESVCKGAEDLLLSLLFPT